MRSGLRQLLTVWRGNWHQHGASAASVRINAHACHTNPRSKVRSYTLVYCRPTTKSIYIYIWLYMSVYIAYSDKHNQKNIWTLLVYSNMHLPCVCPFHPERVETVLASTPMRFLGYHHEPPKRQIIQHQIRYSQEKAKISTNKHSKQFNLVFGLGGCIP